MPDLAFPIFIFLIFAIILLSLLLFTFRKKALLGNDSNKKFKSVFESIWRIEKAVLETVDFNDATKQVVNIILTELGYMNAGYEVIVLTMRDEKSQGLRRIAISNTQAAGRFLEATPIPFNDIIIPFSAVDNLSIRAINERKMFTTTNVSDILVPAITREWVDSFQHTLGIKTSIVYPLIAKDKVLGSLVFSLSKEKEAITDEEWAVLESFVGAAGIALDNALLFNSLNETTKKLQLANEQLEQLDKLKDEFVSLASHELRTPMTVIKSYIWLLLEGKTGVVNDKQKEYLQRTYSSTIRLINMVNDMLNISRIESGRLTIESKQADMTALVKEVVDEMQPRALEQGLRLLFTPLSPLPMGFFDSERIKQVLINLIGNSLKFTPREGSITISQELKEGNIITHVADTGRGIKSEDMEKLFKKFNMLGGNYLTKQSGQGTGLGLYLSKSLVELHGGRIWVESGGENKGSVFSFSIPIAQKK
ncbi:MAG: GAF domain-containing sensor histidine kinase [Candidatus Levybacteria bacterium]|nr:GAF domain-containing sensor histidine kinase [Candidatus Levybacteria bacterium]